VGDPAVHEAIASELQPGELLIADGHHRYETSLAYQREVGAGGPADYVLMALVSLEDPGLTVFPTHRLISGLADDPAKREALGDGLREVFDVEQVPVNDLDPGGTEGVGYSAMSTRTPRAASGCASATALSSTTLSPAAPTHTAAWTRRSSKSWS